MSEYPVNALRNRAIALVQTSHYLVVDVDMWPSEGLHRRLTTDSRLLSLLQNSRTALVVPTVRRESKKCEFPINRHSLERCRIQHESKMPRTKTELRTCMESKECGLFDPKNPQGHSTEDIARWFTETEPRPVECIKGSRWEPYVVLRNAPSTPRFDERFRGYGKNKIQFINHIEAAGFRFYVVPDDFVVHFPHPIAVGKLEWLHQHRRRDGQEDTSHARNDRLYKDFVTSLKSTFNPNNAIQVCPHTQTKTEKTTADKPLRSLDRTSTMPQSSTRASSARSPPSGVMKP